MLYIINFVFMICSVVVKSKTLKQWQAGEAQDKIKRKSYNITT